MDFTFPKNKVLHNGTLKNHSIRGEKDYFSLVDTLKPTDNQIQIKGTDYFFTYLTHSGKNKGGNSVILKLYESQNINTDEISYDTPDLVIKILKFKRANYETKSEKRFTKEIDALKRCRDADFVNVIKIFHNGICKIFNPYDEIFDEHLYYTMEYAPYDLKTYIEENHKQLSLDIKLSLCLSIAEGLKELESLDYYHRDIKPDNIFMSGNDWKIGDLGLLAERNDLNEIDEEAEPIGPRGWMSPESMNKYLTEGKGFEYPFSCKIDHQSDIFQLGKVFWYIFQHNAPIGSVKESDFKIKNSQVYSIIKTMLNHSKAKRYKTIDEVIKLLKSEEAKLLKTLVF
jgi:serine/threonine protein kinase